MPHALPLEVIRLVFLIADRSQIPTLCLVCRTAQSWLYPTLYTSVTLSNVGLILNFFNAVGNPEGHPRPCPSPAALVQRLWIGHTWYAGQGSLCYSALGWPITIIHQILVMCSNLRALTIINLDQNDWRRLEDILPPSLESLQLGPIHGPLILKNLSRGIRLRSLTSANTYLRDEEVRDIVLSSDMRKFRRIHTTTIGIGYCFDQLPCVTQADALEEMQILFCCSDENFEDVHELIEKHAEILKDPRIVVKHESKYRGDWMRLLHDEFEKGGEGWC
ncbi:hypothetical protein PLICRDRAFT_42417 [Plicaturopsis crispa FD-325 SS-3]|nr:hypothetical protein PLICRDRAFT_42417 [Plicaturopsis crispa FD-325 SS-3]